MSHQTVRKYYGDCKGVVIVAQWSNLSNEFRDVLWRLDERVHESESQRLNYRLMLERLSRGDHEPMVEKKVAKELNKSAEIRKVATSMKEKGEKPRPVAIIALLKKQGIIVSSPQVSMVLKKMGFRPRRRRKAGAARPAVASTAGVRKQGSGQISVEDLIAAKKLVSHFGGTERALAAISALRRFES
jgi:hypothetical protein